MSLKVIPKPAGFDVSEKRADKAADASKWLPTDALYSAFEEITKAAGIKALSVAWYETDPVSGNIVLRSRLFNETENDGRALHAELFLSMCR